MFVDLDGVWDDGSTLAAEMLGNARHDIYVIRGSTITVRLTVRTNSGALFDLTGSTSRMYVRTNANYSIYAVNKLGVINTAAGPGRVDFTITPDDLRRVDPGRYVFDIWVESGVTLNAVVPLSVLIIQPGLVPFSGVLPGPSPTPPVVTSAVASIDTIVIGCQANGDTTAVCNYLDTGDGSAFKAATQYAGANPSKKFRIAVRAGVYPFVAAATFTVPANAELVGAGRKLTILIAPSVVGASQHLMDTAAGASVSSMTLEGIGIAGATAPTLNDLCVASAADNTTWDDLQITLTGPVVTNIGIMRAAAGPATGISISSLSVSMDAAVNDGAGIYIDTADTAYSQGALACRITDMTMSAAGARCDALLVQPDVIVESVIGYGVRTAVSVLSTVVPASGTFRGPQVTDVRNDARGRPADTQSTVVAVVLQGATPGATFVGTVVQGVSLVTDAAALDTPQAVLVSGRNVALRGASVRAVQSAGAGTGRGGVLIDARGVAVTDVVVDGVAGDAGAVTLATSGGGTQPSSVLIGCQVPAIALSSGVDTAILAGCRATTLTLNAATNTVYTAANAIGSVLP